MRTKPGSCPERQPQLGIAVQPQQAVGEGRWLLQIQDPRGAFGGQLAERPAAAGKHRQTEAHGIQDGQPKTFV